MKKIIYFLFAIFVFSAAEAANESLINSKEKPYEIEFSAESGMFFISSHTIKFGKNGTLFDYMEKGNQDVVFPFLRFKAKLDFFENHAISFLYQPFEINTKAKAGTNLVFYDTVFPAGTVMNIKYGFSFYRMSYLWYFFRDSKNEFGVGASLQLRNASIIFASADGSEIIVNENVGPVPILKIKGEYHFDSGIWLGIEADGFYASDSIFNGAEYPFTGAIWDISLRAGLEMKNKITPFINLRCLGGGAEGTSQGEDAQGDGYTQNWLNTYSLTLGITLR